MIERCHFLRLAFSSHFLYLFSMRVQVIFHQTNCFFVTANPNKFYFFKHIFCMELCAILIFSSLAVKTTRLFCFESFGQLPLERINVHTVPIPTNNNTTTVYSLN